jgi:hypothetical protein
VCDRLAEEIVVSCAAPAIDCCCGTLVPRLRSDSILFGAHGNQENCVALELSARGKPGSIVLLDFSLLRCAWRAVRASALTSGWGWRYRHQSRRILIEAIYKLAPQADLHMLRNPKALKQFLAHMVRTS